MDTIGNDPLGISIAQREIYDLLKDGLSPERIASKLDKELGIVNAQITRMKTRGVQLPAAVNQPQVQPSNRPASTGPSSNENVINSIKDAGIAETATQIADRMAKSGVGSAEMLHPMILMGMTIQYVKAVGGRLVAHQLIEDVFSGLKQFLGDHSVTSSGEVTGEPLSDAERIKRLTEENLRLTERLNNRNSY